MQVEITPDTQLKQKYCCEKFQDPAHKKKQMTYRSLLKIWFQPRRNECVRNTNFHDNPQNLCITKCKTISFFIIYLLEFNASLSIVLHSNQGMAPSIPNRKSINLIIWNSITKLQILNANHKWNVYYQTPIGMLFTLHFLHVYIAMLYLSSSINLSRR